MSSTDKQLPLVTYKQAKMLKEAGFDWVCTNYFDAYTDGEVKEICNTVAVNFNGISAWCFSRPTIAHVFMWLLEVKGIYVCVYPYHDMSKWHVRLHNKDGYEDLSISKKTYPEAELAALTRVLEI